MVSQHAFVCLWQTNSIIWTIFIFIYTFLIPKHFVFVVWKIWFIFHLCLLPAVVMTDASADTTPFFSDDNEEEGPTHNGAVPSTPEDEESPSGVSDRRAKLTVAVLCFVNLLNYMDRFTVAGVPSMFYRPKVSAVMLSRTSLVCHEKTQDKNTYL